MRWIAARSESSESRIVSGAVADPNAGFVIARAPSPLTQPRGAARAGRAPQSEPAARLPRIAIVRTADRRHRMTIDHPRAAEGGRGIVDEPSEGGVVRPVEPFDASLGLREDELAIVNLGTARHHPGDGPQPRTNPGRAPVDVSRQIVGEHAVIDLAGVAIGVDEGARKR